MFGASLRDRNLQVQLHLHKCNCICTFLGRRFVLFPCQTNHQTLFCSIFHHHLHHYYHYLILHFITIPYLFDNIKSTHNNTLPQTRLKQHWQVVVATWFFWSYIYDREASRKSKMLIRMIERSPLKRPPKWQRFAVLRPRLTKDHSEHLRLLPHGALFAKRATNQSQ